MGGKELGCLRRWVRQRENWVESGLNKRSHRTCKEFVAVMDFCANGMGEDVFVNLEVDGIIYFFR